MLRVLYAVENLVPAYGGAERFALEMLGALGERHAVRAVCLGSGGPALDRSSLLDVRVVAAPRPRGGYWADKRLRRRALADAVRHELARGDVDVVASALHGGPAALAAATEAGVPTVLFLHSYEALCKYAFQVGSRCRPEAGCRSCPSARALPAAERDELVRSRREHARALTHAAALVAPSSAIARDCEAWCGRRPVVAPPVVAAPPAAAADPAGHALLAAARWTPSKGAPLLEALAHALRGRAVHVTARGLDSRVADRLAAMRHVRVVPNAPIDELLAGAALLLVPSLGREAFGRIAFEGMAAGVPTLAGAVGGLRELVPAAQLVEPPESIAGWSAAIEGLRETSYWRSAQEAGRAAAAATLARRGIETIETVLAAAAARPGRPPQQLSGYDLAPL